MPNGVGFEVHLIGKNQVMADIRAIKSAIRDSKDNQIKVRLEANELRRQIAAIDSQLRGLRQQKISLTADTSDITSKINDINRQIHSLREQKLVLQMSKTDIDREISSLRTAIRDLENLKIKIQVDNGSQEKIDGLTQQINKYKATLDTLVPRAEKVKREIEDVTHEISRLSRERDKLNDKKLDLGAKESPELKKINAEMDRLVKKKEELQASLNTKIIDGSEMSAEISQATNQIGRMQDGLKAVEEQARAVEGVFSKIGGAFSTVGGLLQRGSDIFGGRIVNTAKTMVSAFGTMGAYAAVQGTISRYDTMRLFPKRMQHLGFNEAKAQSAIDELEQAVIGLPTGLDEIVASANQLISLTGSLKKGTKLAIATNNAFIAGGADAQQVEYGQRQIRDLLAAGKLRTQEWDSLFKSLGAGLGVIAQQMGYKGKAGKRIAENNEQLETLQKDLKRLQTQEFKYVAEGETGKKLDNTRKKIGNVQTAIKKLGKQSEKDLGQFRNDLKQGNISADEFVNALIGAGTGNGKLVKWADDMKDTISAAGANIRNALQKLGAAGLNKLNDVLVSGTGKTLVENIKAVSDGIKQNLIPALEGWIDSHSDQILDFFNRLKNYDWAGLISRVGNGLAKYYDLISQFFTKLSPKFIAFMSVWGGPVGRILSGVGGLVNGLGSVIGGLIRVFGKIGTTKAIESASKGLGSLLSFGGSLKSAFAGLGLSAGFITEIAMIGGVIAEYAKIVELIGSIDVGNFSKNIGKVNLLATGATAIASLLTGIMTFATTSGVGGPAVAAGEALAGGFVGIIGEIGLVISKYVEIVDSVAKMKIPDKAKVSRLLESTKGISKLLKEVPKIKTASVYNMQNLSDAMDYIAKIGESMKKVKEVGAIGNQTTKIKSILDASQAVLDSDIVKGDDKKSKLIATTLGNTESAMDSVTNISKSLNRFWKTTKGWKPANIEALNKRASIMMDAITGNGQNGKPKGVLYAFQFKTSEYEKTKENTGNVSKAMEAINGIATSLSTFWQSTKGWKHANITALGDRMRIMVSSLREALMVFSEATIKGETVDGGEIDYDNIAYNAKQLGESTRHIARTSKFLARAMKNMNKLQMASMGNIGRGKTGFDHMMDNLAIMLPQVGTVFEGIPEIDSEGAENAKSLADAFSHFPAIVTALSEIKKPIKELGVKRDDWTLGARLSTMMNGLTNAFGGVAESDFSSLQANAASLKTAINSIKNTFVTLSGIQAIVDTQFTFTNGTWDLGMKLAKIMGSLAGAFSVTPTLGGTNVGSMATIAPALQAIGDALGTIASNAKSAAGGLKSAASGVKKLGSASKDNTSNINNVANATKQLQSAVKGIGGGGQAAATGVTALGSAAGAQIGAISNAAGAAARLAAAIESIPSNKTVNISVNRSGSAGTGVTSSGGYGGHGHASRFASGGSVRGPSGIDRVAAWLTNGEYVHRRSAVNYFGKAFMDRINSLDVDGALRSLSIRAGASARRGSYVTNNYRDNHANVTFNVNRASQGYSQRVASRWARSLT